MGFPPENASCTPFVSIISIHFSSSFPSLLSSAPQAICFSSFYTINLQLTLHSHFFISPLLNFSVFWFCHQHPDSSSCLFVRVSLFLSDPLGGANLPRRKIYLSTFDLETFPIPCWGRGPQVACETVKWTPCQLVFSPNKAPLGLEFAQYRC